MEVSTRQTKKGHAGTLPSMGVIHLNCLDAIAIFRFITTRKMSREIPDPRKMWTPVTETNNVCWDLSENLIWLLETRRQLWAALQNSAVQLLSQPFKNFSWNKTNSCKWSVKRRNEDMLSKERWSEGNGDLTSHNVLCSKAVRIFS